MDAERWKTIKEILEKALERAPDSRAAFLDERCANDAELRREVEKLLAFERPDGDPLECDAVAEFLTENNFAKDQTGRRIGNYTIVGELGSGGMGAVFLAERADDDFRQKVALKLIKRGLDSESVVRRFLNERRILATLEHPHIARLVDGGAHDGVPYFVMEYVAGEGIVEYADKQGLSLGDRLKLFADVCAAVSFAHRNLVIHRDLKPSNILVTDDGVVKLLDFGIAKLLDADDGAATATQTHIFTPDYASPEQIRGEKLTTSTDVYSLGVVLYELLTGRRPFKTEGAGLGEVMRLICDSEPSRPSTVERRDAATNPKSEVPHPKSLRGDLDAIILKALRKEPERRYASVEQFAEDLRLYSNGLPVTASAGTFQYRASKFLRRNRVAAVASALLLLTLVGGLATTLYQRNKAQRRFNDVRQLANSFLFEFHDAIENLPGSIPARELVVKRALEYLDRLSAEGGDDPQLLRELATAYQKIGKIQGNTYDSNLGDTEGATKSYRRSLEIRQRLIAADPTNRELRHELADSLEGVGDMDYTVEELEKARDDYAAALVIRKELNAAEPDNLRYLFSLGEGHRRLADVSGLDGYSNLGDTAAAIESYRAAVSIGERLIAAEPDNKSYQSSFGTWTINLAMLEATAGEHQKSIANGWKAIAMFEKIGVANGDDETQKLNLLSAYNVQRFALVEDMQFGEAERIMRTTIAMLEKMVEADPKNRFLQRSLGVSYNSLGRVLNESGDPRAAVELHRKVLKTVEALRAADPENGENNRDLRLTREFLAAAELKAGDAADALKIYRELLDAALNSKSPGDSDVGPLRLGVGRSLTALGQFGEAADILREAIPDAETAAAKTPLNAKKKAALAILYYDAGVAAARAGKSGEAREVLSKGRQTFAELATGGKLSKLGATFAKKLDDELARLG